MDLKSKLFSNHNVNKIITIISQNYGQIRFIGGCVRDAIICKPISDIDLATTLLPKQVKKILENNNIKTLDNGLDQVHYLRF